MAVLKTRNRLVYFRVSEEEFQRFTTLCEQHSSRSISDLARRAMERLLAGDSVTAEMSQAELRLLSDLLRQVSLKLDEVLRLPTSSTSSAEPPPAGM